MSEIERRLVQEAIEHCHGNQVQAAALLGLSRDQLRYRMHSQGGGGKGGDRKNQGGDKPREYPATRR
jgi:two-component system NtrC family response regulator